MREFWQDNVEDLHKRSVERILDENGRFMENGDRIRVAAGADDIRAVEHDPECGHTGLYAFRNGISRIEVSAVDEQQIERTVTHETNHFASRNREVAIPEPGRGGYRVCRVVGVRETSWFHSCETGEDSEFVSRGEGMNEGITTMYTNRQLAEISPEKGHLAERAGIYPHAVELCRQLESLVGEDTLKEAYYGGEIGKLRAKVDEMYGDGGFELLRESMDRSISSDYTERIRAMIDAQEIMERMYENGRAA